jgi:hypothetical protein
VVRPKRYFILSQQEKSKFREHIILPEALKIVFEAAQDNIPHSVNKNVASENKVM